MSPFGKPAFTAFLKEKEIVAWLSELSTNATESTHGTYVSCLFNYWQNSLSKTYPTLWVARESWIF